MIACDAAADDGRGEDDLRRGGTRRRDDHVRRGRDDRVTFGEPCTVGPRRWERGEHELGVSLLSAGHDARAEGASDDDRGREGIGGGRRCAVGADGGDDLARLEGDLARGAAGARDDSGRLDVVSNEDRSEQLDLLIAAQDAFVAVDADHQLRGDIAEQCEDARRVDEST